MTSAAIPTAPQAASGPSSSLLTLLAVASGALVANLYYAQPLVTAIAPQIGVRPELAGSVVGVTQIGYGAGLLLLVSLADLVENRRLALTLLAITTLALAATALSRTAAPLFLAAFVIGSCSTAAQVLVLFAAHLAPEARRGRVVGNVMAGVLTGIMLARPASLFIAASFGWRAVFWASAVLMVAIGLALVRLMPQRRPHGGLHYGQILASMAGILAHTPALRWRGAYQALLFGAFNLFWTAAPLMLAERFHLSGRGVGLFALAGAGGALAAPVAGRLADRGLTGPLTAGAMAAVGLSFLATGWAAQAGAMALLVALAIVLDAAVQTNHVVSQRIIFSGRPEVRGRVNALYMTVMFAGGAAGSVLGTLSYHAGGWTMTAVVGGAVGGVALLLLGLERLPYQRQ